MNKYFFTDFLRIRLDTQKQNIYEDLIKTWQVVTKTTFDMFLITKSSQKQQTSLKPPLV